MSEEKHALGEARAELCLARRFCFPTWTTLLSAKGQEGNLLSLHIKQDGGKEPKASAAILLAIRCAPL
jgi:hypothetical protein